MSSISSSSLEDSAQGIADAVRIGAVLGEGRHGVVLTATLPSATALPAATPDDGAVTLALKIPSGGRSLDHEAAALRLLAHPGVVSLIDGPSRSGALLLERCEGGTLGDRVENPLTDGEAVSILGQLAQVLSHIHDMGWVHADISPGNIGIRADGTVALLDFATAQLADGSEIYEGTDGLAGTIRAAQARLDIRCSAASIRSCLATDSSQLDSELAELIERCDNGSDVAAADLGEVGSATAPAPISPIALPEPGPRTTKPSLHGPGGSTREFGPRPGGGGGGDSAGSSQRLHPAIVLGVGVLALFLAFSALYGESPAAEAFTPELPIESLAEVISAAESMERAGVEWTQGFATLVDSGRSFAVGEPGDIAATGDWDCSGTQTLGVYRPSTGSWFTFDSWDPDATSTTNSLQANAALSVQLNNKGCATPRLVG